MWARTSATAQRCSVVAHRVIEHAPLPPSEQRRRYRATHKRRRDAKQSAAAGEYEHLFWPEPRAEAADSGDEQDDFSVDSILEKEDVVCG